MAPRPATGIAYARAGLLGNPSDQYGGKTIAFSIRDFAARVSIQGSDRFVIRPGPSDLIEFASFLEARDTIRARGCDDGIRLLRAAIRRFADNWGGMQRPVEDERLLRFEMSYETNIPRQVGLAGSSAIVIAALRALMGWFETTIDPAALAELALAAELEDLGIAAGPMDRVVQCYEGVMLMDLREPRSAASYTRLVPEILPPLFVAWDPRGGRASGRVHQGVRRRWQEGDEEVHRAMAVLRELVDSGSACLQRGDHAVFRELMDQNFDIRARLFTIAKADREMVEIGRSLGAAIKLCGSGGAVVGAPADPGAFGEIERAYRSAGYRMIRPEVHSDPQRRTSREVA
jgi:glucuronokinase